MKRFFSSLRLRLILIVLLAVMPAMAVTAANGIQQRRLAHQNAEAEALRLTREVASYQNSLMEGARQLTSTLSLVTWDPLGDAPGCDAMLKTLHQRFPVYSSLNIASTDGKVLCSSVVPNHAADFSAEAYFQEALQTSELAAGEAEIGAISGNLVIPTASAIRDAHGQARWMILAGINLQTVVNMAQTAALPQGSVMLIVEKDGRVLARYPTNDLIVGRELPDAPVVRSILAKPGEGQVEMLGLDNVRRLYAFTPVQISENYRLVFSIGIPTNVIFATTNRMIWNNLIWIGIIALIALAVAWFVGDALFLKVVSLTAERDAAEERLRGLNQVLEEKVEERTVDLDRANFHLNLELEERRRAMQRLHEREAELEKMLTMLEQSNRELENFAYITSHDLQEPLRKIQAFGDRLSKNYNEQLGEQGIDYIQRMRSAANRMQTMVNDLLAYSRVTSRAGEFVPLNLNVLVDEVIEDLEIRIADSAGQVIVEPLPTITADASQIRQLMQNLLTNALKFHRKGVPPVVKVSGEILSEARGEQAAEEVLLKVEDNGIGFEEEYLDRIFLPFQRLVSRDSYEGSGIGLAICRKIVERHGGSITAKSAPEQGSCFMVRIPRYPVEPEEDAVEPLS